jgi:hypothetical protein
MSKKAFDMIAAGLDDAIAIAKGEADPAAYRVHAPADVDVLKIRRDLGLTREAFAMRFGLELGTSGTGNSASESRKAPHACSSPSSSTNPTR